MAAKHIALDGVSYAYIAITIIWTVVLLGAISFLYGHRELPMLRIRRLPLVFTSMLFLQVYGALCMLSYILAPIAPCSVEYWIMNILVPCGTALFQAANSQFLHIASQQKKFTSIAMLDDCQLVRRLSASEKSRRSRGLVWKLRRLDKIVKMVVFILLGMVIQTALTISIFFLSRKFHPSFGILPANLAGTDSEQRKQCSRGWEWWPSIVWQFFWSWIYAPYILWRSRNIQDTHGWRLQTIFCCIAGLPASPLWLTGLYSSAFEPVNKFWAPPQWFSLSIIFIQAFTLLTPCYNVLRHNNLRHETLQAIQTWEQYRENFSSISTNSTRVNRTESAASVRTFLASDPWLIPCKSSFESRRTQMYTMAALDHALKCNATPLQRFAALKDFSGENIGFLSCVYEWRKRWNELMPPTRLQKSSHSIISEDDVIRERFNKAIQIYASFVSLQYATFPISLASKDIKALDILFAYPSDLLYGSTIDNSIRSNSDDHIAKSFERFARISSPTTGSGLDPQPVITTDEAPPVWYWGPIPQQFHRSIFDDAEHEIKQLVLTNTWPKFVNDGYQEELDREKNAGCFSKYMIGHHI